MIDLHIASKLILLVPLAVSIIYYDVKFRRIPNSFVLATFFSGLIINITQLRLLGFWTSLGGLTLAFSLMLVLFMFGELGSGDVKLFGAIGSVIGHDLVITTFFTIVVTGGVLAILMILRLGTFRHTMQRVLRIFIGLLPGKHVPRFNANISPHHTIPYGVAITGGTLISLIFFSS
jgi:prepilin peptidase CpaA